MPPQTETSSGSILIVEDEDVLRMTFEEFLTEEGYVVFPTASFKEALVVLEEHPIDVVVSDIILGGYTGMDLLKEIHDRTLPCKVVMITGDPSLETAAEAVRLSAFEYLAKPVNGGALLRVVRLAMERKNIEDERDRYRSELDTIFNSVGSGILTVDVEMRLQQANKAARQMLGLSDHHMGKAIVTEQSDGRGLLAGALRRSAVTGESVNDVQFELLGQGKQRRVYVSNTASLSDGRQRRTGAVAIIRDITRLLDLEEQAKDKSSFQGIVGRGSRIREVFQLIEDLSDTDTAVLILGESGTGKELVAEAIHRSGPRSGKPLIKVNCAALAEEVLESELFGHVRGAFTGAVKDREGRFEAAHGGTLFLDEIGDISQRLQTRLLRVLQEGEFERVGDSKTIHVDARIIAATNRNLPAKIAAGEFRQDLYYRLNVVQVQIPALRERLDDLPALVDHFVRAFNGRMKKEIAGATVEAMDAMLAHTWPGNIRELENCIERAFVVCREIEIRPEHLPREVFGNPAPVPRTLCAQTTLTVGAKDQRLVILNALEETDWNIAKSARKLGMSRSTFYQRMQEFEIARDRMVDSK